MWKRIKPLFRTSFSLREMILATTAVAGLIAAFYVNINKGFEPSPFILQFRPLDGLAAQAEKANGHGISYNTVGGSASYDERTAINESTFELREPQPPVAELLLTLESRVKKALAAKGYEILGTMRGKGKTFSFAYKYGKSLGYVSARSFESADRREIIYLAIEHQ
jgi:hypothetical protein